jgi:hypothetical protein
MNTFYKLMIVLSLFSGKAAVCAAAALPDIFEAIRQRDIGAVRQYIDAGGDVNVERHFYTPLTLVLNSIQREDPEVNNEAIFTLLVHNGANINIETSNGVHLLDVLEMRNKLYLIQK